MHKHPNHFNLGRIGRTHGLTGDLICVLDTDKPHAYAKLDAFFLEINNQFLPYFIRKFSIRGSEAYISLEGVTNVEQASRLKGAEIYLPLEKLPKPGKNEFYFHDLIGCTLTDKNHGELGVVEEIIETAGQKLISFTHQGKEVLIPFVKQFVTTIDTENKTLKTELPVGLLELYLEETRAEKDDALEEEEE